MGLEQRIEEGKLYELRDRSDDDDLSAIEQTTPTSGRGQSIGGVKAENLIRVVLVG